MVAKVNGTEIRQSDLAAAEEDIGQNLPPMAADAKRDYLITYVTDMIILAKAAEAKKLGDSADFKRKLDDRAQQATDGSAADSRQRKTAVTDEAMKQGLCRSDQADGRRRRKSTPVTSWSRRKTKPRRSSPT